MTGGGILGTTGALTGDSYDMQSGSVSAALAGTAALVKTGVGTVSLSGANTYSGGTAVTGGTLVGNSVSLQGTTPGRDIENNSVLVFNEPESGNYNNVLSGSGAIVKTGTGTLTLAGTHANTCTGSLGINGGVLALGANDRLPDGGAVTISGGVLDVANFTDTVGAVTLSWGGIAGTTGCLFGASYDLQSGVLGGKLGGPAPAAKTTGGTVFLGADNVLSDTADLVVSAGTLDIGIYSDTVKDVVLHGGIIGGTTGMLVGSSYDVRNGQIGASIGGSGPLSKTTTGTVDLSGSNTYHGQTTVHEGTLVISGTHGGDVHNYSALTVSGTHAGSVRNEGTLDVAGILDGEVVNYNALFVTGTHLGHVDNEGTYDVSGLQAGSVHNIGSFTVSGVQDGDVDNDGTMIITGESFSGAIDNSGSVLFNQPVQSLYSGQLTGTGTLEVGGSGSVLLAAANPAYAGTITVNGGTLLADCDLAAHPVNIVSGGIGGNGSVGELTLASGVIVTPGTGGAGTFTTGNQAWGEGGSYRWDLAGATGTRGAADGWDYLNIQGTLDIAAGKTPFEFKVTTPDGGPENFDLGRDYLWKVAGATGGISGYAQDVFAVDSSDFGAETGFGTFGALKVGKNVALMFKSDLNAPGTGTMAPVYNSFAEYEYPSEASLAVSSDGSTLYGMTYGGGAGYGYVYKVNSDGSGFTTLDDFDYSNNGAYVWFNNVVLSPNNQTLYGTTCGGGADGFGVVFKASTTVPGDVEVMHSFAADEGKYPYTQMAISPDGNWLYGMTYYGNGEGFSNYWEDRRGTLFRVGTAPAEGTYPYEELKQFDYNYVYNEANNVAVSSDGQWIYGAVPWGSGPEHQAGYGMLYKIRSDGAPETYQVLHEFIWDALPDGSITPYGMASSIQLSKDEQWLYGMSNYGGTADEYGTVYKIRTDGTGLTVLYSFEGPSDDSFYYANGFLSPDEKYFYGIAPYGGDNGEGLLFRINVQGGDPMYTPLYTFNSADEIGGQIYSYIQLSPDGKAIYGTTDSANGVWGAGSIFAYYLPSEQFDPIMSRLALASEDPDAGTRAEWRPDGKIYYIDAGGEALVGPGDMPSISGQKVLYRSADGYYHLWEGGVDTALQIEAPAKDAEGYDGLGKIYGAAMVLEGVDGIYYSDNGADFVKLIDGTNYRNPGLAGDRIVYEKYNIGDISQLYLLDMNAVTLDMVAEVKLNYPAENAGAAPWMSYDASSGIYYVAWQGWDADHGDWDIFLWDSLSDEVMLLTTDDQDWDDVNGKWFDDMYPVVDEYGSLVLFMRYDDWDIYSWSEDDGVQVVSAVQGVDEMYPSFGAGGTIAWGEYDPSTGDFIQYGGTFQQGEGGEVPEPSTLLLLLPLIGFGIRRMRGRRQ